MKLIATRAPVTGKCLLRLLMRIPIAERRGVALDFQSANFSGRLLIAIGLNDTRFVAIDDLAKATELHIVRPVGDVNMKHLRRPDTVADLNVETIHPSFVYFYRQSFACRVTKPETRNVLAGCFGYIQHRIDHCGYRCEDRRSIPSDQLEHFFTSSALGETH